jgi:hypothetical protein
MNVIPEIILRAMDPDESGSYRHYRQAFIAACELEPPPYGTKQYGDKFREVASDPFWFASSILTNAEREAEGSSRLWNLAASTEDRAISACVKRHAIDESRHARWYVAILDLVFPGAIEGKIRVHADAISPRYTAEMEPLRDESSPFARQVTVDDLVQMNIAEIRTAINQKLQLPLILAYCPEENRSKLLPLLETLQRDEICHIEYSARLIERFAPALGPPYITDLMIERMRDFNEITCEEVELGVFPLHCSNKKCWLEDGTVSCIKKRGPAGTT